MKALIINIGDELLSGKTINTNSSFIARQLNKLSITVEKVIVIADDEDAITKEITNFRKSDLDILITTGGLGPTHDDLTKETIASALGLTMELDIKTKNKLERYFNDSAPKSNFKQAYFPKEAIIIENDLGTAPGAIIPFDNKHYFILVGPPYELRPMVINDCFNYLKKLQHEETLIVEYLVIGAGESFLEDLLANLISRLKNVSISPYASIGKIRFQIKAFKKHFEEFEKVRLEFEELMSEYIVSNLDEEVEEVLLKYLEKFNYKISFSESITGGMVASRFINVSGASKYLEESLITYSDEAKVKYLNVSKSTIDKYGVVSEEVVKEMVEGLQNKTNTDVALAVTGYAGPTGIKEDIGLVYFGIKIKEDLFVYKNKFRGNRQMIRERATLFGLYKLISLLKNHKKN